jgi:cell division septation protein DedD/nucleoid DNA-binding protein
MVKTNQYICELLFTNDCVIIPGLGGFVSNTRSTFLNPSQHTFTPPSKKVAFNSSLRTNDGLLAHYISQEENITYHEANEAISAYVDDVFRKLALGEQISIEEVGTLSMDMEKHLQFEPETNSNFLLSSFGMTSLHSPAIKREEVTMEVVQGDKQKVATPSKRKTKLWKIIELVPAAAVLAIMIFNPRVVHTLNNNLGNIISVPAPKEINVSDRPEVKKDGSNTVEIPADNNKTEITPVVIDNQNDSFNQKMIEETAKALQDAFDKDVEEKTKAILAGESIETVSKVEIKESKKSKTETVKATVKETKSVVEKKEKTEIKEVKTSTKEEKSNKVVLKKYNVIGGVFSIKDNANNYVKKSQADGYPAAIAGKNKRGYWVVSLASANSEAELEATLESIKATYEKNAWIYKK